MSAVPELPDDGVVVRIRLRGVFYDTRQMPLADARDLTRQIRSALNGIGESHGFLDFDAEGYPELYVRAARVTAVEIVARHRGRSRRPVPDALDAAEIAAAPHESTLRGAAIQVYPAREISTVGRRVIGR